MYSWRTIRTVCVVLLLLPIVHLTYLIAQRTMATLDPSPQAWADEVEAYVRADTHSTLPANPVVVVGGERVRLWHDLTRDLAPTPVLLRGIGDAIVEDITYYYERLIAFYQPGAVVLLPGTSEFFIRDSKSADDLVGAISALIELDTYHAPERPFYVIAPLKTPLRTQDHPVIDATTEGLATLARDLPKLRLLDANPLLTDSRGSPRARYFRSDGIALNEHGYLRLSTALKSRLEHDRRLETSRSATR